jgi:hypothetical protein
MREKYLNYVNVYLGLYAKAGSIITLNFPDAVIGKLSVIKKYFVLSLVHTGCVRDCGLHKKLQFCTNIILIRGSTYISSIYGKYYEIESRLATRATTPDTHGRTNRVCFAKLNLLMVVQF